MAVHGSKKMLWRELRTDPLPPSARAAEPSSSADGGVPDLSIRMAELAVVKYRRDGIFQVNVPTLRYVKCDVVITQRVRWELRPL